MAKEGGWLIKLHKRVHKLQTCEGGWLTKLQKRGHHKLQHYQQTKKQPVLMTQQIHFQSLTNLS